MIWKNNKNISSCNHLLFSLLFGMSLFAFGMFDYIFICLLHVIAIVAFILTRFLVCLASFSYVASRYSNSRLHLGSLFGMFGFVFIWLLHVIAVVTFILACFLVCLAPFSYGYLTLSS